MENVSNPFTTPSSLLDGAMPRPRPSETDTVTERRAVKAASTRRAEWTALRTVPVNALLVGPVHLTAAAMAGIDKSVRQPVVWWAPDQAHDVPEVTAGTLVIRDVDRLDDWQQEHLSRWMGEHGPRVQVLALARASLFAQVVDGRFSAALYYRMNTVMLEVRAPADLP
jgi:hypothetical protein